MTRLHEQTVRVISMGLAEKIWQDRHAGAKPAWSFISKGNWALASQEGYNPAYVCHMDGGNSCVRRFMKRMFACGRMREFLQ